MNLSKSPAGVVAESHPLLTGTASSYAILSRVRWLLPRRKPTRGVDVPWLYSLTPPEQDQTSGWGQSPADRARNTFLSGGSAHGVLIDLAPDLPRVMADPRRIVQEPHSATADFDLVRLEMANEVDRQRWTLSLQFLFLEEIPPDLILFNPMGIIINYLQGDRATVTGDQ